VKRRVLNMEVRGKRVRGRPRRRWMECINEDLIEKKLEERCCKQTALEKSNEKWRHYLKWEKPGKDSTY
jgi:hypothetical protein